MLMSPVLLLRQREQLRSIVMGISVCLVSMCVCLSAGIFPEPRARSLSNFLYILPMSVARSSSGMLTIGRIAYCREGVFFLIDNEVK